jgi:hypothetical protein
VSFLGFLASTPGSLFTLAALIAVAVTALIWDHHAHPEPSAVPKRPDTRTAHREPPHPHLTGEEQQVLTILALRMGAADPKAGRILADWLRTKCPNVPDVDLMRAVIALAQAARYFHRNEPTATDALDAYLRAMSSAALDLTALERSEQTR